MGKKDSGGMQGWWAALYSPPGGLNGVTPGITTNHNTHTHTQQQGRIPDTNRHFHKHIQADTGKQTHILIPLCTENAIRVSRYVIII